MLDDELLSCGRCTADPYLHDIHPETGEERYQVSVTMKTKQGSFMHLATERELDDLPTHFSHQLARSGSRERVTEADIESLRVLAMEVKTLLNAYVRQGRSVEAWKWDFRERMEQQEAREVLGQEQQPERRVPRHGLTH